jgi:MinD-like ATPase involved in chromosome partitioning or flagellar assembly
MANEDLTFKINSDGMQDTIDNMTKETREIADMCDTAKQIVEEKLAEHGLPGDITQVIVDAYERDVISKVEKNNEANEAYINKSTTVNEEFIETQNKNNSLFN